MNLTPRLSIVGLKILLQAIVIIRVFNPATTQSIISPFCTSSSNGQCKTLQQVLSTTLPQYSHFKLEAGTHALSRTSVSSSSSIILDGEPDSTTISCSTLWIIQNVGNIRITNIKFSRCNLVLTDIAQLDIQNSKFTDDTYCVFTRCNGMVISQSDFYNNNRKYLIEIRDSKKVKFIQCNIKNNRIVEDYAMISLLTSTLNIICCGFQRNELSKPVSSIVRTIDDGEIRVSNSSFTNNRFLDYGRIITLSGMRSRLTVISSIFENNSVGNYGSTINSLSDNDIVLVASHILNTIGGTLTSTVDISSGYARLILDCTKFNGNTKNDPRPIERVITTNVSEYEHNSMIAYDSSFERTGARGCILEDVSIGWEKHEYILEPKNILQDFGIKICAIAIDVMFPVWIQYKIIPDTTPDKLLPLKDKNYLLFQIKSGLQRKCILIYIPENSASGKLEPILAILHSTDPNVNITRPSVNITVNNTIQNNTMPVATDSGISGPSEAITKYTIIVVVCAIVAGLEGVVVIVLCGIIFFCRSKTSHFEKQRLKSENEVNFCANDSYSTTLTAKAGTHEISAPVHINSYIEDPEEPLYDVPASD